MQQRRNVLSLEIEEIFTRDQSYHSPYFGKIEFTQMGAHPFIKVLQELSKLDTNLSRLKRIVDKQVEELQLAFMPYLFILSDLNILYKNGAIPIIKELNEMLLEGQTSAEWFFPKFRIKEEEIFQPSQLLSSALIVNLEKQIVILCFNRDRDNAETILEKFIHGIQRIYNNLYLKKMMESEEFSPEAIKEFLSFSDDFFVEELPNCIVKKIQEIVTTSIRGQRILLDELSGRFTGLFLQFLPSDIRAVINDLEQRSRELCAQGNELKHSFQLSKLISKAFRMVELTLTHLSRAFAQSKANQLTLLLDTDFNPEAKKTRLKVKELQAKKNFDKFPWYNLLSTFNFKYRCRDVDLIPILAEADFSQKIAKSQVLKDFFADIVDVNVHGYVALMNTVIKNDLKEFKILLEYGIPLTSSKESTLLHVAATFGHCEMLLLLIVLDLPISFQDKNDNTPLFLLTEFIQGCGLSVFLTNPLAPKVLTYLLSYSQENSEDNRNAVYQDLINFRKNIAILYSLLDNNVLKVKGNLPEAIIDLIASHLLEFKLKDTYYHSIIHELKTNPTWLSSFLDLGRQDALKQIHKEIIQSQEARHPEPSEGSFDTQEMSRKARHDELLWTFNPVSADEAKRQLMYYYSPLSSAANSLAALCITQKQMQYSLFSRSKKTTPAQRLSHISVLKREIEVNEQKAEGLPLAIIQTCRELGIQEITHDIYMQFSEVLNKLFVKQKKTPLTEGSFFTQQLKASYQYAISEKLQNFKV